MTALVTLSFGPFPVMCQRFAGFVDASFKKNHVSYPAPHGTCRVRALVDPHLLAAFFSSSSCTCLLICDSL